ncbi:hypothetical protein DFP97_103434 [Paenibacillus prosopidis]|uniref:Uncharacterized protein n=1 Tax=Paenibacillus prosopidis TaxID=630520 RepID=A0A368WBE2_9BACL|nr:hypothetical protein DFP97_103434 [Paenibacillus prosopidis]
MPKGITSHMLLNLSAFISGYEGPFSGQMRNLSKVLAEVNFLFE